LDQVQNVLQQLEYNNLLLLLIHKDQGWYRYHALLQTVLQRRMRSLFTPAEVDVYYSAGPLLGSRAAAISNKR
jgi:ATP/maltotriose-dependent transcriptional regulator MalT